MLKLTNSGEIEKNRLVSRLISSRLLNNTIKNRILGNEKIFGKKRVLILGIS
jgi:hypothetical protein